MDTKLFEFGDFEIWKRGDKYFARYDAGAHQVAMREDEISEEEAKKAMQGEKEATDMLFSLQKRLIQAGQDVRILPDFQREIAHAARASFDDLRSARPGEHFYAYALYTDSSAMTMMPAANTVEGLMQVRKEMDIPDDEEAPEFKWSVSEWKYEAWKAGSFNGISSKLRSELEHADFPSFAEKVHTDMVAALKLLESEGFFGTGAERNKIVLFVSISNDDDAVRLKDESAQVLNPTIVYEEFLKRYA